MHWASDFALFRNLYHGPSEPVEWKDGTAQFGTCLCDGIGFKINVLFKLFRTSGYSRLDRRFNSAGVAVLVCGQFFKC